MFALAICGYPRFKDILLSKTSIRLYTRKIYRKCQTILGLIMRKTRFSSGSVGIYVFTQMPLGVVMMDDVHRG